MTAPVPTVVLDMPYLYAVSGVRRRKRATTHERIADSIQVPVAVLESDRLGAWRIEDPETGTAFDGHVHEGRVLFDACWNDKPSNRRRPFDLHPRGLGGSVPIAERTEDHATALLTWFNPQIVPGDFTGPYERPFVGIREFSEPDYSDVEWTDKAARRAEAVEAASFYAYVDGRLHTSFVEPVLTCQGGLSGGIPTLDLADRRQWNPMGSANPALVLSLEAASATDVEPVEIGRGRTETWAWRDVDRAALILARKVSTIGRDVPMGLVGRAVSTSLRAVREAGEGAVGRDTLDVLRSSVRRAVGDLACLVGDEDVAKATRRIAASLEDLERLDDYRNGPTSSLRIGS